MNTYTKKLLTICLLFSFTQMAMADRGMGKRNKNKSILNIATPTVSLRNSIGFNLKSGLKYSGSLLTTSETFSSSMITNSIVTYQKGNTTYIIPYKHKIIIPELKQGYAGMKLIIRSH